MGFWSNFGKVASVAAPFALAPFTGGTSMLAKFAPAIAQGVGMLGGAAAGKAATKNAQQRSPEELAALKGATDSAGQMMGAGSDLLGQSKNLFGQAGQLSKQGINTLQQPINYYQSLLSGNRAAMSGAVAPAVAQITGNYRGAGRALEHSGLRGAARDVASADLNRQRVSQIAGLTTGVQGDAAKALAGMSEMQINAANPLYGAGTSLAGTGGSLYGNAGNIYGNLLGQGANNRAYARQEGEKTGAAIGAFARDLGQLVWGKGNQGTAGYGGAPLKQQSRTNMGIPNITATPFGTAQFPNRVSPPLLSGGGSTDWFDPSGWGSKVRFMEG